MKKKLWLMFASLFSCILLLVSCTGDNNDPSGSMLTLTDERVSLTLLEEYTLLAEYNGDEDIVWTSSNPNVVTVDNNGKIVGKKEGSAIITAIVGDAKDTCEVVVDGYLKSLLEVVFVSPQIIFYEGEVRASGAELRFANAPLSVAYTKTFVSSNPAVATVDNYGNITAVGVGAATITATFTVKNQTVSGTLFVNVQSLGRVEITQGEAMLYVYDGGAYGDNVLLSANAYDMGRLVEDGVITWSTDVQDVISVSSTGIVTALNPGTAVVTARYSNSDGEYTDSIIITVLDYIRLDKELFMAKNRIADGYSIDLQNLTGDNDCTLACAKIKTAENEIISLSVDSEKIYFNSPINSGKAVLILETGTKAYEVSLEVFDISIKNVEEFNVFCKGDAYLWYCLEADLDFSNIELWGENRQSVLSGVFDGKGNSIKGLTVAENSGLFNELNGAYVKNLNIIDVVMKSNAGVIAQNIQGDKSVIENVYVSVKDYGGTQIGGMFSKVSGDLEVKNSCVYLPVMGYTTDSRTNGFVAGEMTAHATISNCVFIGGNGQDRGYVAEQYDSVPTITDTIICSALEAHKTYSSALTDLGLYSVYNANHPYLALNNDNFTKDTFDSLTTQIVDLTESITAAGELNLATKTFTGVFEGNGKSITGLKISGKPLLGNLTGATIRNVVIIDAELTNQNQGVLAYCTVGTATNIFDNVYISLKAVRNGGNGTGAMIDRGWGPMIFKDVVIYVDAYLNSVADVSFVQGSNCGTTITTIDCTFIGPVNYTKYGDNDSKIVLDANTGKYKKSEVTDDVLTKMSDQNYEAYTGTPRAIDENGGGDNGNTSGNGGGIWSHVVPLN